MSEKRIDEEEEDYGEFQRQDAKPIENEQVFGESQMEKSFRKFLVSILPEGAKDFDFETLNQGMLTFINKNIEEAVPLDGKLKENNDQDDLKKNELRKAKRFFIPVQNKVENIEDRHEFHEEIFKKCQNADKDGKKVNIDHYVSLYIKELNKINKSYLNIFKSLCDFETTKLKLSSPLSSFKFFSNNNKESSIEVIIVEVKSGKLKNEKIGTFSFLDANFIEKSANPLQLKSSSNFHEWGYKIATKIIPKNVNVIVEIFDFSEEFDKVGFENEESKDAQSKTATNYQSRMDDHDYKGKVDLQITEVIMAHIMDNQYVDDKIIKEEHKEDASNSNGERPSMKIPGVLRLNCNIKLGADFKSTLEKLIAEKLKEINNEIKDKSKRANEKAELLEQGVFWCEEVGFLERVGMTKRDRSFEIHKKETKFRFEDPEKMRWRMCSGTIEGDNFDAKPDCCSIF